MHPMYNQSMSAPHTPTTSGPNTPMSMSGAPQGYQQMAGPPLGGQYMQNRTYSQPMHQSYHSPSGMMPPGSSGMSMSQSMAPVSVTAGPNRGLVPLRPMTAVPPLGGHNGMQHPHLQPAISFNGHALNLPDSPTHVVGSQGRRGILPSAPGRPPVTALGPGSAKNAPIPAKDADGKFPCPHCTKTYLHAKHLKRHLFATPVTARTAACCAAIRFLGPIF
jgi:hypothetical protein